MTPSGEKFTGVLPNNFTLLKNQHQAPIDGSRNKIWLEAPEPFRGEGKRIQSMIPEGNEKRQGGLPSLSRFKTIILPW